MLYPHGLYEMSICLLFIHMGLNHCLLICVIKEFTWFVHCCLVLKNVLYHVLHIHMGLNNCSLLLV